MAFHRRMAVVCHAVGLPLAVLGAAYLDSQREGLTVPLRVAVQWGRAGRPPDPGGRPRPVDVLGSAPSMTKRPARQDLIVVGIGSTLRGDDRVGLDLVRRVQEHFGGELACLELSQPEVALAERLAGFDELLVVDAAVGQGDLPLHPGRAAGQRSAGAVGRASPRTSSTGA